MDKLLTVQSRSLVVMLSTYQKSLRPTVHALVPPPPPPPHALTQCQVRLGGDGVGERRRAIYK